MEFKSAWGCVLAMVACMQTSVWAGGDRDFFAHDLADPFNPKAIITTTGRAPPYFFWISVDVTGSFEEQVMHIGQVGADGLPDSSVPVKSYPFKDSKGPMLDGGTHNIDFLLPDGEAGRLEIRKSEYNRTSLGDGLYRVDMTNEGLVSRGNSRLILGNKTHSIDSLLASGPSVGHWPAATLMDGHQTPFRFLQSLYDEAARTAFAKDPSRYPRPKGYQRSKKNVFSTCAAYLRKVFGK